MTKFALLPADKQAEIYDHMDAIARVLTQSWLPRADPVEERLWTECCGFRVFYSALANERVVAIIDLVPKGQAGRI
ncbi:MAG TPA: hypothetical protein VE618_04470 [Myxococcaceae bacterium]|nr:hypothetical protein [Myxococcaceae bacterium]HZA51522.1 hypothetical protein [Myxococcaceae bacterium]